MIKEPKQEHLYVPLKTHQQRITELEEKHKRCAELEAENKRLREALAYYADKGNWSTQTPEIFYEKGDGSEGSYVADVDAPIVWTGEGDGYWFAQNAIDTP